MVSTRNKIICALFMCAFVIYTFRTVSGDTPAKTATASLWSYFDPTQYSLRTYAAAAVSALGFAQLYSMYKNYQRKKEENALAILAAAIHENSGQIDLIINDEMISKLNIWGDKKEKKKALDKLFKDSSNDIRKLNSINEGYRSLLSELKLSLISLIGEAREAVSSQDLASPVSTQALIDKYKADIDIKNKRDRVREIRAEVKLVNKTLPKLPNKKIHELIALCIFQSENILKEGKWELVGDLEEKINVLRDQMIAYITQVKPDFNKDYLAGKSLYDLSAICIQNLQSNSRAVNPKS